MPHCSNAAEKEICCFSHCRTIRPKLSGTGISGLPNLTPFAFAAAIPSACLFLMFSRSLCATKDNICNTRSAIKVPIRSLPFLVSKSGISRTQISTPISFVSTRHWFWISSQFRPRRSMLRIYSKSPAFSFFTSFLYWGRLKSFPDCLSIQIFIFTTPFSFRAKSCLSSFWSVLDTRTQP